MGALTQVAIFELAGAYAVYWALTVCINKINGRDRNVQMGVAKSTAHACACNVMMHVG